MWRVSGWGIGRGRGYGGEMSRDEKGTGKRRGQE